VTVGRLPTGHLLAGHIVGRAGGQPYAGFLTEKILAPLELTSPFMILKDFPEGLWKILQDHGSTEWWVRSGAGCGL